MSILEELNAILDSIGIPVETGVFSDKPPLYYVVLTPLSDDFDVFGDNKPTVETCEVRLSLFNHGNYIERKNSIVQKLLDNDFTITGRTYVGFEPENGYHNYAIDVAKNYEIKEDT